MTLEFLSSLNCPRSPVRAIRFLETNENNDCDSKEGGTGRYAEQRIVDGRNRVGSIGTATGEAKRQSRKTTCTDCKTSSEAVGQIAKSNIAARERNLTLVGGECEAERSPDRVFNTFPQQKDVGCAETIIVI